MKLLARTTPALPAERITRISGFGTRSSADGYLYRPTEVHEIRHIFDLAKQTGREVVLRGAGRSYGDANIADEAIILDITRMKRILNWDKQSGIIECEAGATIEDLWRTCIEDGYWPPVVSGTMYPTLAGALAMNIHGKNNFCQGTLGEHVTELDVLFPTGDLKTLTPKDDLLYAVIGSAGLLGVITRVKMQMKKIHSGDTEVLPVFCRNWDDQFATFESFEHDADYLVSWIDCFGRGANSGRGQIHVGWYTHESSDLPASLRPEHQDLPDTILGRFPKATVWRILRRFNNRLGMRLINTAKNTASKLLGDRKMHPQSLVGFSFLLDYVPNWRNAYLPGGFIQYQSFVPKERAREVFGKLIEMQQDAGLEAFLGVLKRHRPDKFLLTHAVDGYSLALDFKVTDKNWPRIEKLCHQMNDVVLAAGGRFYFAKDSTMRPSDARAYLGDSLNRFQELKKHLDPEGLLTSKLAERLQLFG
ncbi:MAG: FAD-dependent oxidoreductase [Fimbriimonas sp.]